MKGDEVEKAQTHKLIIEEGYQCAANSDIRVIFSFDSSDASNSTYIMNGWDDK